MAAVPYGLLRHLHLVVLLLIWSNANALNYGKLGARCRTPKGQVGSCIDFCLLYSNIMKNGTTSPELMSYLKQAQCGLRDAGPLLCCPKLLGRYENYQLGDRYCGRYRHVPFKVGGRTKPITPNHEIGLSFNRGGRSARPAAPMNEDRLEVHGGSGTETPTAPASSNPFRPTTTGDRLVSTGPDVVSHPNWRYLNDDICGMGAFDKLILGGEKAQISEFPCLALLTYQTPNGPRFLCGGSLISNRYVLTSAGCVTGPKGAKLVTVRLGEHNTFTDPDCRLEGETDCADPVQDFNVAEIIVHPLYQSHGVNRHHHHDIALIRLDRDVNFNGTDVLPICLPNGEDVTELYQSKFLFLSGWGTSSTGTGSNVKLSVQVPVVNNTECQSIYGNRVTFHDNQMCAGGRGGRDACVGDTGGPLIWVHSPTKDKKWRHYLATGLLSLDPNNCGSAGVPAVYTRIGPYMNWILDSLKP